MPTHRKPGSASDETLPPSEVRFTELRVEPWPDGRRVRVHVTLTPFQQNPSLEAVLSAGAFSPRDDLLVIASTSIIETNEHRLVFTMHLPPSFAGTQVTLTAAILYAEIGVVDERSISFEVHPADSFGKDL